MKTLYLDIFSGLSGDMFLGAMMDLGVDFEQLEKELGKLGLDEYHLHVRRRSVQGIRGCKFEVHLAREHERQHGHAHSHHQEHGHAHGRHHDHDHHPRDAERHDAERTFAEIKALIQKSNLSAWVKERSVSLFHRLALAEGKVHGHPPEAVHFHEVGAVDSIVDIVGACVALEMLGKPRVLAALVVDGHGWVDCAHGRFPVPALATLEILGARGIPLTQCEEPQEILTPTGAALLAEFAESFGPMPNLVAEKVGYGFGTRELKTRPNCLRVVLGTATPKASAGGVDWQSDRVAVLETNLDDINAEVLGAFVEQALAAGALDVYYTPVTMKKSRPGVVLTVLCAEADGDRFAELILRETTAFGVRQTVATRRKLARESLTVATPWGEVSVKLGKLNGKIVQTAPEFESCKKLARASGVELKTIYAAAVAVAAAGKRKRK